MYDWVYNYWLLKIYPSILKCACWYVNTTIYEYTWTLWYQYYSNNVLNNNIILPLIYGNLFIW